MKHVKIKEKLAAIKLLCDDLQRHLDAGAIVKANSNAVDIHDNAQHLFELTYNLAFQKGKERDE